MDTTLTYEIPSVEFNTLDAKNAAVNPVAI